MELYASELHDTCELNTRRLGDQRRIEAIVLPVRRMVKDILQLGWNKVRIVIQRLRARILICNF